MALFALYKLKFDPIVESEQLELLFPELKQEIDVRANYANRLSLLAGILKEEYGLTYVIHQKSGDVTYDHLSIDNPESSKVFIQRFANNKEKNYEDGFQYKKLKYKPSCLVIIDLREGVERVAIQYTSSAFTSTKKVSKILSTVFCEHLKKYRLSVKLEAEKKSNEFWAVTKRHPEDIAYMCIGLNKAKDDAQKQKITDLVTALDATGSKINGKPRLEYIAESGECLHLHEDYKELKAAVERCSEQEIPIILKTRDGVKYKCLFKKQSDEKVIMENLNIPPKRLAILDNIKKDLFDNDVTKINEFMTGLKLKYDV